MTTEVFVNSPSAGQIEPIATLMGNGGSISPTATTFNIQDELPEELQSGGQFRSLFDNELIIVPCQTGTALTGVTRGAEGTVASAHNDGAFLYPLLTSGALNNALANILSEAEAASDPSGTASTLVTAEATTRANADTTLAGEITTEATTRAGADTTLTTNLGAEISRAEMAEATKAMTTAVSSTAVTGTQTVAAGTMPSWDISAANGVGNLPNAPANGTRVGAKVRVVNATPGTFTLTLACGGSDHFPDGSTSVVLEGKGESKVLEYDAGVWTTVSSDAALGSPLGAVRAGSDGYVGTIGKGGTQLTPAVESSSSRYASGLVVDLNTAYGATPATQLTVTLNGTTSVTVTAGAAPASGSIIANGIPQGTTFTASGSTLTLSNAATASGSVPAWVGMDITSVYQAAYNALAATGNGGTIEISVPGVYLQNGPQQTGTYVSPTYTGTLNGSQTFPETTVTLNAAPSTWLTAGTVQIAGVTGLVSYTGISGSTLTGCSGGTGTAASGAAVAMAYAYSGQMLVPATPFDNLPAQAIKVKGMVRPNYGIVGTGQPVGVVILSSATGNGNSGWDVIPYSSKYGWMWTGTMPIFEDVISRGLSNPTANAINAKCLQRFHFEGIIDTIGDGTPSSTGAWGIIMPAVNNNGDIEVKGEIHGYPTSMDLTEHAVLPKLEISFCTNAFSASAGVSYPHTNWFGYVDVENCNAIFQLASGVALNVVGHIDYQAPSSGIADFAQGAGVLDGSIKFYNVGGAKSIGMGSGVTVRANIEQLYRSQGSSGALHPQDNFARSLALTAGHAPGLATSGHAWITTGTWLAGTSASLQSGASGVQAAYVKARNGGEPRNVTATITIGASYDVGVYAQNQPSGNALCVRATGGAVTLYYKFPGGTTLATSAAGIVTASSTITLGLELHYRQGVPFLAIGYLNGVAVVASALTPTQQAALTPATGFNFSITQDGVMANELTSVFTSFVTKAAEPPLPAAIIATGVTATHTAMTNEMTMCSSGTFTVTLPPPVQFAPPNTVVNQGTGTVTVAPPSGTLTNLSGTTGNITLAQGTSAKFESLDGTNYVQIP
jgi:hypothetical protein